MITNNFNKELRGISDALRDLGYTDSTIGLRQRYWKEYCFFHGSLDIDEASMDEFLLKNYDIQSGNINVSKRQYEVRAALRNLLEYRRYGKIRNYHTPWFKDLPWVESFRAITENFISHLRSQNSKPETIVNYERTLKRITNHLHSVGVDSFRDMTPEHISSFLSTSIPDLVRNLRATLCHLRVFFRYLYLAVVDGFRFNKCSPKRHIVYPLLFRVLCFCGLRISEALNLTVGDVHFEDGFFLLRNTKTSLDRLIPLDDNLRARFMAYSEQMGFLRKDEYFFPSPDGSRYSLATMDTTFRDILFRAGILYRGKGKGPRLHDLRHTFCVHSLQKLTAHGEDPYAVLPLLMTYMGHRTVQATSQYIHLSAESFPAILKQSEALFGNLIPLEDNSNETSI